MVAGDQQSVGRPGRIRKRSRADKKRVPGGQEKGPGRLRKRSQATKNVSRATKKRCPGRTSGMFVDDQDISVGAYSKIYVFLSILNYTNNFKLDLYY